jgi:hypothetical protein
MDGFPAGFTELSGPRRSNTVRAVRLVCLVCLVALPSCSLLDQGAAQARRWPVALGLLAAFGRHRPVHRPVGMPSVDGGVASLVFWLRAAVPTLDVGLKPRRGNGCCFRRIGGEVDA